MATKLIMPKLGLTMTEGTVSKWLKHVGDTVLKGDEIVEIETDKINTIVESNESGVILKICLQEGESGPVQSVLCIIGQFDEKIDQESLPAVPVVPEVRGKKRIVVIGAGPGGYVTAIKAAQLGAEVSIIESDKVGGTCLNVGCIPTKALIHVSSVYELLKNKTADLGITLSGIGVDWAQAQHYKKTIISRLVDGVEGLLKANGIAVYRGRGIITDAHTVQVGAHAIRADYIILAVGSEPVQLRFPGADFPGVLNSTSALALERVPPSLVVIGGGVVGVEFASLFASLGTKVTIVEALSHILPPIDGEITAKVRSDLEARGIKVLTDAKVGSIEQAGSGYRVNMVYNSQPHVIDGEKVLLSVGRKACTAKMGLEKIGIAMDRGKVTVDENFQSSVPGIFAIGDCNGKLMLAHAASAQGIAAIEYIMTGTCEYHAETIPSCIYVEPEVASVGMKEEELKGKNRDYKVGKFQLSGNGKALIESGGVGMIKILADSKYGQILGVHIYGPRATDLIAACALAIRLEATVDELTSTIFAHPTVSEALGEAALAVFGNSIHWPPKK